MSHDINITTLKHALSHYIIF